MILNFMIIQIIFFQFYFHTLKIAKIKKEYKQFITKTNSKKGLANLELLLFFIISSSLLVAIVSWEKKHVINFKKELESNSHLKYINSAPLYLSKPSKPASS